jgi:hypothetical protein
MLQWQRAEGRKHALERRAPTDSGAFVALCGSDATVQRQDIPELGGHWFEPTCMSCESAWRAK